MKMLIILDVFIFIKLDFRIVLGIYVTSQRYVSKPNLIFHFRHFRHFQNFSLFEILVNQNLAFFPLLMLITLCVLQIFWNIHQTIEMLLYHSDFV